MAGRPNELDSSKSLHTIEASLLHALLLAAAGGYLDAFTFVGKGGVFANAMTGNVVIMGSLMAAAKWTQAWFRIPPIAAFIAGVWCAKIFDLAPLRRIVRWPLMTSLGDRGGFVTGWGDGTERSCGCLAGAWYLIRSCAAELNVLANRRAPREHGDNYRQLEKLE
jgi:hypothetical protein